MADTTPFGRRRRRKDIGAVIGLLVILAGLPACRLAQPAVSARSTASLEAEASELAGALRALGGGVDAAECVRTARVLVHTVEAARVSAGLDGGPIRRNLEVAIGWHDWGLCWQWTERLGRRLRQEPLKSLSLHWACAHAGSDLREHNALVITAKGQPFQEGLVIDPWRRGGRLVWVRVADDRYPWKHEPWSEARWEPPASTSGQEGRKGRSGTASTGRGPDRGRP